MNKLKSHKTVEEIAKKHRLDVSFIQKQLDMGEPIEHEHTKDHELAKDIALQHLDEIPDYYTRLKKMEASAKKEHKKFKDVKEALDGKSSKDPDYSLRDWFKGGGWVQTGGKYDGKPCAKQPGQTTKPYCRDPDDRASMDKEERNKRSAKKRREDPNPNRSGKAKMVTQEAAGEKDACYKKVKSRYKVWPSAYASGALSKCRKVGASNWGTKSENMEWNDIPMKLDDQRYCPKCQKNETKEECKYGSKYWEMFSIPAKLSDIPTLNQLKYDPNRPHPANEEKDHEYSMARSEISTIISAAKRLKKKMGKGEGNIEAWVQSKITKAADYLDTAADYIESGEHKVDEACWDGYTQIGMKKKGKKTVPNCVKKEEYSNWREELFEDWQSINRKDKTDGLSQKSVNAYRRENPGSKLQTAVTEKNPSGERAGRRKRFCSRMSGMKSKLTSAETARDPDSDINKALRRWRCR